MSSPYLFVFCLCGLQLAGQVLSVPSFICEYDAGPPIGCVISKDMNSESFFESQSLNSSVVIYTLQAEDKDDNLTAITYEIVPTNPNNLPPSIDPADGFDYLDVDLNTGEVRFHTPIDYERFNEMRPTWRLTSVDSGATVVDFVIVGIDNVNDVAPNFINEPYISNPIPENTTFGTVVFSNVDAVDGDSEEDPVDGPIIFTKILDYNNNDCDIDTFIIDEVNGDVILNNTVSYLGKTQYTVCIEADDQGNIDRGGPLTTQTTVRLSISDVQGESPTFIGVPYRVSIPEDTAVGTTVDLEIYAQDGDTGVQTPNDVFITLTDGAFGRFTLESFVNEAKLIVNETLDREVNSTYSLEIQAREDDNNQPEEAITSDTFIDITISDVNDEAPVFSNIPVPKDLPENSPTNTPLNLGVTVSDGDTAPNAKFTLSLVGAEGAFMLLETEIFGVGTVDVRVKDSSLLDYEARENQTFNFMVVASEEGHPNVTLDVTVILTDVNDNSPIFANNTYVCSVLENSLEGTPVCQLTATDADSPELGNITYSLEGSGSDRFNIDMFTGLVTVAADAILDAETQDIFFLTVLADDGDRIGTTLLQINLDDVNDVSPVFNLGPTEELIVIQEFSEPNRTGELLVMVTATDGDVLDINQDVTYSITGGNEAGKFDINAVTGEITLNNTIDYETDSQEYNINVTATNTEEPFLTGSAIVTVLIADINDNAPTFEVPVYQVNVSEDATVDEHVISVTATDADKPDDPNSRIDYRITSGAQDQFRINVASGEIVVNDQLDREAPDGQFYILEVQATDRGLVPLSGTCMVMVNITDVNDVEPIFDPVTPINIAENYTTGEMSVFYTVSAYDPDLSADLQYMIDSENIEAFDEDGGELPPAQFAYQFGIVENTGGMYANYSLDREMAASFIVPVWVMDLNAQDPDKNPQEDMTSLTITILDVNDNTPRFLNTPYAFNVDEHEEEGAVISAEISATDPDLGLNGVVQYTKQSGSGLEYVEIGAETGVLTAAGDFNREEHATLEVVIRASDSGTPPNFNDVTVTLTVNDLNDNPPVFNSTIPGEIEIYEDLEIGTKILRVTATDLDVDHGVITYAITAGNTEQKFEIVDAKIGIITTKNTLDRETTEFYILTITASDKGPEDQPQQDVIEVTINILDVNDKAPEITSPEFDTGVEVIETVDIGATILFVAAVDGDEDGSVNSEVEFSVGGGNGTDLFGINSATGEITTLQLLSSLSGSYELVVVVRDRGDPPLESNRTLDIEVLDVNDDDPIILFPEQDEVVYLEEGHSGPVLTIDAVDNDRGLNGRITYEFVIIPETPEDYKKFTLNNETGDLSINEVTDRETQESYRLFIQAANRFSDELRTSPTISFTVAVNDTNDNSPVFREPSDPVEPLDLSVGEELEAGTEVGSVATAEDKDGPGNNIIYYFIVDGNSGEWFILDKDTGLLSLLKTLDREEQPTYTLIIKASSNETYLPDTSIDDVQTNLLDPGADPSLLEVVIEIVDRNDKPPVFVSDQFSAGVLNTYEVAKQVVQVTVTDEDTAPANRMMSLTITSQQNCIDNECTDLGARIAFGIDQNDTWIYTIRKFEPSERGYYQLTVLVVDPTNADFKDEAEVNIYLITEKEQVRVDFTVPTDEVLAFNNGFREFYASLIANAGDYENVAVNLDDIQVYTDDSTTPITIIETWTYMIVHAVDLDTNIVIPADIVETAIDDATVEEKDQFFQGYSVYEVNVLFVPEEPQDLTLLQWIFLGVALAFMFLFTVVVIAFVFTRKDYRRKLRAATAGMMGGTSKPIQPTVVPGTNLFAGAASNPVFNEKPPPQYEEMETESTDEGESVGGSEDQEFTVNMYDDENDQTKPKDGADNDKLLMAVLEELESTKHGLDNIDVTDV